MAKIHMVLQGKGGVGKSMIAAVLAQYMAGKGVAPLCIDTDPVNPTFEGYKSLGVRHIKIMDGEEINTRHFDEMVELISGVKTDVVIDNGSPAFVPMCHYLISNEVPEMLTDMGHELVIHTVITGGQALLDTVSGFSQLVTHFPKETRFIVWLNPYWGPIQHDGKDFEQMKAYATHKSRITAIVQIPSLKADTFGRDFSEMLQRRETFAEAAESTALHMMTKQRLRMISKKVFGQLDEVLVVE